MACTIQWLGHASFKFTCPAAVIYLDPWKLARPDRDATLILVSHSHYDHYSPEDIAKISTPATQFVAPPDVIAQHGAGQTIAPGQTLTAAGVPVIAVPAYNPQKQFHPKTNHRVGFILELDGKRIYYAGDTDATPEMLALKNIDLALLPVGGTYTMAAAEAAAAVKAFAPKIVLPCHWGDIVGSRSDAEKFQKLTAPFASCHLLAPGQTVSL